MADHTFKYPNTTSPTTTLTFTRAWFQGDAAYYEKNQETDMTIAGNPMTKSFVDNIKIQPFTVQVPRSSESATDWADVETFINSVVNFAENQFYWTDQDNNEYLVIMENNTSKPEKEYANYNEYTFLLRILG